MPPTATSPAPLVLFYGDDDLAVKQKARELFQKWCGEVGGMDHETIDAACANAGEALRALGRLREALQTLPFFGGGKVVWFKDCNFLGEERTASAGDVVETLASLAEEWKQFNWSNVRLIISATKADRRRTFFKTIEKLGSVQIFAGLSMEDRDWEQRAASLAQGHLRALKKNISPEALDLFVETVGPHTRQLASEAEKLALYVGDRADIGEDDVAAIVTRSKHARAFAVAEALGDRNLPAALRALDEELWAMQSDKQRSEIGVLYGLISKVRSLLLAKELLAAGHIKPSRDLRAFQLQLSGLPADLFGGDRKIAALDLKPYPLFRATQQADKYQSAELVRAMDLLLDTNFKLVSSGIPEDILLQQVLTKIISRDPAAAPAKKPR
jgi:DNA polymerase-3 subunit delta